MNVYYIYYIYYILYYYIFIYYIICILRSNRVGTDVNSFPSEILIVITDLQLLIRNSGC